MDVTWVGGSCFRLRGRDTTALTDPQTSGIKQRSAIPKADVVTISSMGSGALPPVSSRRDDRDSAAFTAKRPGEYEVAGVYVHGVCAPSAAGREVILYAIDIDSVSVGHIPELTDTPGDALLDDMGAIHILLIGIRIGSEFVAPHEIIKTVNRIEPNIVIPYGPDTGEEAEAAWQLVARELCGTVPAADDHLTTNRRQLPDPIDVRLLARKN